MGPPEARKRVAHQDESAFHSVWKIVKFEEVFPDKIRSLENVQVQVKHNQNVSSKSKFLISIRILKNNEEDDDEDVKRRRR